MRVRFAPVLFVCLVAGVTPEGALAQPAADSGKPTPLSGITVAVPRKFTTLSGVTLQTFLDRRPCRMSSDGPRPGYLFDQSSNAKTHRADPSPGTEEYLRKDIDAIAKGARDYDDMTPQIAANAKRQLPVLEQRFKCLGDVKSIKFLHVSDVDFDDYEIDFKNGALELAIAPLNEFKRSHAQYLRFYEPKPMTDELRYLIASLQKDHPDRGAVSPALAPDLEDRWPILHDKFKGWGRLESIDFVRKMDDGSYVYLVTLGRSGLSLSDAVMRTAWSVKVAAGDNKFVAMTYAIFNGASAKSAGGALEADGDDRGN